jgi:adenosylhomocysteine nucleosidase
MDTTPRIALMTAFEPEWNSLIHRVERQEHHRFGALSFVTGVLEGREIVLTMSGMSMVNAAMTTQSLFDRFTVTRLIFTGIAGGIDPALCVGDVIVPARWAQSLEIIMGRKVAAGFEKPGWLTWAPAMPAHGMMMPNSVIVGNRNASPKPRVWFEVDPQMLEVAEGLEDIALSAQTPDGRLLDYTPKLVVGGAGVSSSAFIDNADYRDYVFATFEARVADMESAAAAHVAYANDISFIAFRSLSDLAGAEHEANEMNIFMSLAAENSVRVVCCFLKALP